MFNINQQKLYVLTLSLSILFILLLSMIFNPWIAQNYWIIICIFSISLFVILSFFDPTSSFFSIGSFVIIYYILFFLVRGMQLAIKPQADILIRLNYFNLNPTLSWIGISMIGFVISYFASKYINRKKDKAEKEISYFIDEKRLLFLTIGTTILAFVGLIILFVDYGGFSSLFQRFSSHSKVFQPSSTDTFGIMFWTTFYSWSIWLWTLTLSVNKRGKPIIRLIFIFLLILYLVLSVFIFGSRTYIITILFGVAIIYHWRLQKISNWLIIIITPLGLSFSYWIVGYRTRISNSISIEGIINNLGHSVLDVMLAIVNEPLSKRILTSTDRWLQIPIALIPRILWPGKPIINFARLDWIVAFIYNGNGHTINAGNPPSIYGEWFIYGGWYLVVIVMIVFGIICGISDRWIIVNRKYPIAFLIYLPISIALITYFKDGDIVLFIISLIKSLIIGLLFALFVTKTQFRKVKTI